MEHLSPCMTDRHSREQPWGKKWCGPGGGVGESCRTEGLWEFSTDRAAPVNLAVGLYFQIPSLPKEPDPALREARHTHTLAHAGGTEDKEGI